MREAEKMAQLTRSPACIYYVAAWNARLALATGEVAVTVQWAAAHGWSASDTPATQPPPGDTETLTYARLLIAQRQAREALAVLKTTLATAEQDGRTYSVIEILALQALGYQALGQRDMAMRALARALLLAEPEGFVRIFVEEGPSMAALLRAAAAQGHSPGYVQRLLAAFGETAPGAAALEPLSERELDVLRLMAVGLTNPEIAAELVIAVSTVKTHVNRIYGKLDVRTRTQAVARARQLQLLD
jgi:LuxR family maltose regulon positive regulatory protein